MGVKIQLETPFDIHAQIKQIQLDLQKDGNKKPLAELYFELLRLGLEVYQTKKPTE